MLIAAAVSASVILFDPIFQGLAISLMAGEVALQSAGQPILLKTLMPRKLHLRGIE